MNQVTLFLAMKVRRMRNFLQIIAATFVLALLANSATAFAQTPSIVSTSPTQNELNVSVNTNISVTFDMDMDAATINDSTFVVNARSTGLHLGAFAYDSLTKTVTFDPDNNFHVGEVVTVVLVTGIQSSGGIPLDRSYVWSFTIVVDGGTGSFVHDSVYQVGDRPWSVFAADLDGDGDLDLATANFETLNVTVLLNNGDGTFIFDSVYSVGEGEEYPLSFFAADLDGDGDIDLTTGHYTIYEQDRLRILFNNGDGTFTLFPGVIGGFGVGDHPVSIFASDLDGDGNLDLATANAWSADVCVLLNNGDGMFFPPLRRFYPVGNNPYSVFAADLDRDWDLDLTTANYVSNDVSVLLNNGDSTFALDSVYPVGDGAYSIFATDLDGDGDVDLATANYFSYDLSILLNNGDGTFTADSVYPVAWYPQSVFAADLDGDGDLDLATANGSSCNVSVLLNNGDGHFAPHSVYPAGGCPASVFVADLDGDGDLDLATANDFSGNVSVLLNHICGDIDGDGNGPNVADLTYLVDYLFRGGPPPSIIGAADVNGDGNVNIADLTYLVDYLFRSGPPPVC